MISRWRGPLSRASRSSAPGPPAAVGKGCVWTKGYDYDEARGLAKEFGYTAPIRARGEDARKIKQEVGFKARRWVVERTHSWMNRFRRILPRWEKKLGNDLGFPHLACALITCGAAGLLR